MTGILLVRDPLEPMVAVGLILEGLKILQVHVKVTSHVQEEVLPDQKHLQGIPTSLPEVMIHTVPHHPLHVALPAAETVVLVVEASAVVLVVVALAEAEASVAVLAAVALAEAEASVAAEVAVVAAEAVEDRLL